MRIRKRPSSALPDHPATTTTKAQLACELNISPWDVTPFTLQSEFDYQFEIEDDYGLYACSKGEDAPLAAYKWVKKEEIVEHCEGVLASRGAKKRAKRVTEAKKREDGNYVRCLKTDGKTWQCRAEAQQGEVFCEHHVVQLKSYYNKYNYSTKKSKPGEAKKTRAKTTPACATVAANKRRNKGRVESKPADYYYYSGFGPSWGKTKRGNEIRKEKMETSNDDASDDSLSSMDVDRDHRGQATSSSMVDVPREHHNEGVFYDYEDEDDDDDDEENAGKERIRKPIKARSLKSIL